VPLRQQFVGVELEREKGMSVKTERLPGRMSTELTTSSYSSRRQYCDKNHGVLSVTQCITYSYDSRTGAMIKKSKKPRRGYGGRLSGKVPLCWWLTVDEKRRLEFFRHV